MILLEGKQWGTAAQIAAALGPDVTAAMVRRWAERDGLRSVRSVDGLGRREVRFPLDEAAAIEARKRRGGRGRPRQLDNVTAPP
ncbi:hypothetical protein [Catellatospora sp. NPDC049609]|uniref:hypothetical protein n=1 Tax=Catellatospora sp. NPDC049609 TaxID=3155505 RepID=UPI00341EABE9